MYLFIYYPKYIRGIYLFIVQRYSRGIYLFIIRRYIRGNYLLCTKFGCVCVFKNSGN